MGLAAFNRMRQLEAMKPENIEKAKEEILVEEPVPEVTEDIIENEPEISEEDTKDKDIEVTEEVEENKPAVSTRRRNRK